LEQATLKKRYDMTKDVITGLKIFLKYYQDDESSCAGSCLYAGGRIKEKDLTPEELNKLESTGWRYSEMFDCWRKFL
jgi:hypothetical protein